MPEAVIETGSKEMYFPYIQQQSLTRENQGFLKIVGLIFRNA